MILFLEEDTITEQQEDLSYYYGLLDQAMKDKNRMDILRFKKIIVKEEAVLRGMLNKI